MEQKRQILLSEIVTAIKEGKTRSELRKQFNITNYELSVILKHPTLKDLNINKHKFALIDDVEKSDTEPSDIKDFEIFPSVVYTDVYKIEGEEDLSK